MRQPSSSVLPETGSARDAAPPRAPAASAVVERIAGWSARHRKTAVLGWLVLVAAVFMAGHMAARQERAVLRRRPVRSGRADPAAARGGHPAAGERADPVPGDRRRLGTDPADAPGRPAGGDRAVRPAALRAGHRLARSSHGQAGLVAGDGRSALVTFKVPGRQQRGPGRGARPCARWPRSRPAIRACGSQEAGDASTDRAANALIGQDFRKAEVTSVPVTLILLVVVFGALIAAGIPLLLAATAVTTAISLLGHPRPVAAGRVQHVGGGADHRDGGRHRLLAVLPAPGAGGAGPGRGHRGGAASRPRPPRGGPSWSPG